MHRRQRTGVELLKLVILHFFAFRRYREMCGLLYYYCGMHYSAKRGIASACCLSVRLSIRLSVTLVDQDHIAWKSWKLTAWTISPSLSLFVAQRPSTFSQGNSGKFWGDRLEVGWEKVVC